MRAILIFSLWILGSSAMTFGQNYQEYLNAGDDCFGKSDYVCARKNYILYKNLTNSNIGTQKLKIAEDCISWLAAGDQYYTAKEYSKALEQYSEILKLNVGDVDVKAKSEKCREFINQEYLKSGDDCFEKGDYVCALKNYIPYNSLMKTNISGQKIKMAEDCIDWLTTGDQYYNDRKYPKALEQYSKILRLNAGDVNVKAKIEECSNFINREYMKAGDDCFEKGDYTCAKKSYMQYDSLTNTNISEQKLKVVENCMAGLAAGDLYYNDREYAKAIEQYSKILQLNAGDVNVKEKIEECSKFINAVSNATNKSNSKSENKLLDIEMVFVEGGIFTMGCTNQEQDCNAREKPAHTVTLSSYYIGKYEVTQAQWKAVMGNNPSHFKGDNLPVEQVSWNNVQEFIRKLNSKTGKKYRLLTEAEWEYAAGGGSHSRSYKYSGGNNHDDVAWYYSNSENQTHEVGSKQANELGIYDMSGNVWEWCQDWYKSYYNSNSQNNPQGPSYGNDRILRGGSWNQNAEDCRISYRDYDKPGNSYGNLGFRLACNSD